MSFRPIYEGWDIPGRLSRQVRKKFFGIGLNRDVESAISFSEEISQKLEHNNLATTEGIEEFASETASEALVTLGLVNADNHPLQQHLTQLLSSLIAYEGWFALPRQGSDFPEQRSELWELEDQLKRVDSIVENLNEVKRLSAAFLQELIAPLIDQQPQLLDESIKGTDADISFETNLLNVLEDLSMIVEHTLQLPFSPDFEPLVLTPRLQEQLEFNLHVASGGVPGDPDSVRTPKLPTKQSSIPDSKLSEAYLGGTPLLQLFDYPLTIGLPQETRFEHHHIVAGSGHGKTQTLQHLILHDLKTVTKGEASIVVIDSQSDLINNIANLEVFASGGTLEDRLVLIDPTDIEWPVALNLFDVGMDRLGEYSQLDRERLTNSILELYDFVLGSLLDAGMTQKQTIIFRYITRLLLHIPNATIHTLRELLEDGGFDKYEPHINKLQGSAKAFFENEFNGSEFKSTKRQVLRRLYGILENQTFERMFSHPRSKLDLFSEMNAGKVILINTAKDLLKENGTEIFGRFFIAMIAQAAQERAILEKAERLPTFVYIDEANDYFDRNIGIILSQARKYNIGMVLAHQFLGQLDNKLHEAIAANTSIKFAGGVSAKDARALASDLRTDANFIEKQKKLTFAAHIKGQTERAVSIVIEPGRLEAMGKMSSKDREEMLVKMRKRYAVYYTELDDSQSVDAGDETASNDDHTSKSTEDDGSPMKW